MRDSVCQEFRPWSDLSLLCGVGASAGRELLGLPGRDWSYLGASTLPGLLIVLGGPERWTHLGFLTGVWSI